MWIKASENRTKGIYFFENTVVSKEGIKRIKRFCVLNLFFSGFFFVDELYEDDEEHKEANSLEV
jgi:hypothetical protein